MILPEKLQKQVRTSGGRGAVLKLGVPDRELAAEAGFLRVAEGETLVKLLEADPERGALLLNRIRPGTPLSALEDDQEDGWVVIDPKGVIADPAYEAARFQHNPIPTVLSQDRPVETVRRRLRILEEIVGCGCRRLLGWAYVDAVLSACWSLEEGTAGWRTMLARIETYEKLQAGVSGSDL